MSKHPEASCATRSDSGAVLPMVLLGLLVVAAATFALSFKATLDTMAARSSLSAAVAQAQASGALALAVAERHDAASAGQEPPPTHGPWPQYGVDATVSVAAAGMVPVTGSTELHAVATLTATAVVGRATAITAATVYFAPAPVVLWRR